MPSSPRKHAYASRPSKAERTAHLLHGDLNADAIGPPPAQPVDWNDASNDRRSVGELSARIDGEAEALLRERAVPAEDKDEANEDAYVLVEAGVRSFRAMEDGGVMCSSPLQ